MTSLFFYLRLSGLPWVSRPAGESEVLRDSVGPPCTAPRVSGSGLAGFSLSRGCRSSICGTVQGVEMQACLWPEGQGAGAVYGLQPAACAGKPRPASAHSHHAGPRDPALEAEWGWHCAAAGPVARPGLPPGRQRQRPKGRISSCGCQALPSLSLYLDFVFGGAVLKPTCFSVGTPWPPADGAVF